MARVKGTVKWFSQEKGYGFITAEGNQDYFFGVRDIIGAVLPVTGSLVTFTPSTGPKGPKAIEITILSQPEHSTQDNKIKCPHCAHQIIPRLVTYKGESEKSLCPFCGGTVKDFTGTSILDDLGDIFWGMIRNIAVAIIDTATAIVIEIKKSKKK